MTNVTADRPKYRNFNPNAIDGLDFWTKLEYGEKASIEEKQERKWVVEALISLYRSTAKNAEMFIKDRDGKPLAMLINELCGDLLELIDKFLYTTGIKIVISTKPGRYSLSWGELVAWWDEWKDDPDVLYHLPDRKPMTLDDVLDWLIDQVRE